MNIIQHFEENNKKFKIYSLKEGEIDDFLRKLPEKFRLCYISDEELKSMAKKNGETKNEYITNYVLPNRGSIMSGDFGEILSYLLVIDKYKNEGIGLEGPQKWRWKPARNKPAPCSDAILFHFQNASQASAKDKMISIESKMKASKSKRHRIQEAIDGAQTDRADKNRAVKTLHWLHEKYGRYGMKKEQEKLERFRKPSKYGTYEKIYKAIAIIDKEFVKEEIIKDVSSDEGIKILIISIKRLLGVYQDTYKNIICSVEKC